MEISLQAIESFSDEQVMDLIHKGFSFKHKKLEEYIKESKGEMKVSDEFDWGEPVGSEIW
jgi:hypothetical protein